MLYFEITTVILFMVHLLVFIWASFDFMLKSTFISHLHYFCWLQHWLLIQGWWLLEGRFFWWGEGEVLMPPPRSSIFYQFKPRPCCCLENRERDGRLHFFLWKWTLSFQSHLILITWTMFCTGTLATFPLYLCSYE